MPERQSSHGLDKSYQLATDPSRWTKAIVTPAATDGSTGRGATPISVYLTIAIR